MLFLRKYVKSDKHVSKLNIWKQIERGVFLAHVLVIFQYSRMKGNSLHSSWRLGSAEGLLCKNPGRKMKSLSLPESLAVCQANNLPFPQC